MKTLSVLLMGSLLLTACVEKATAPEVGGPAEMEDSASVTQELLIEDEVLGTGAEAKAGDTLLMHYVGTLEDGTQFDSSYSRKEPFEFTLGVGQVIQGWDQGVLGMKVGGKRKLTIPSDLAYGDNGIPGAIPGGATLIFELELLEVK